MAPAWSLAIDDLKPSFDLDLGYHYQRMERTTIGNGTHFLSRTGGYGGFQYDKPIRLFSTFYLGGDISYSNLEAAGNNQIQPSDLFPWQIFFGFARQLGGHRDFEIAAGLGFSNEFYQELVAFNSFSLIEKNSLRAHISMSYRFLSMIGTSARLRIRYFYPLNTIEHGATPISYRGVLDSVLRLKFKYRSNFSLFLGVRFEDFQLENNSTTYFNTRIFTGFGLHF